MCNTIVNEFVFVFMQVILTKSSPVVFANYSLVEEEEKVSRIAAVQSEESLLFVIGNKVPFLTFSFILSCENLTILSSCCSSLFVYLFLSVLHSHCCGP